MFKKFSSYAFIFLFIFIAFSHKVYGYENESILDNYQKIIANKYADRYCSAKADHFFEGLENEKTLKYSYFQYIGLMSEEISSLEIYKQLINQIREKCLISNEEEREINKFYMEKFQADLKLSEMSEPKFQKNK